MKKLILFTIFLLISTILFSEDIKISTGDHMIRIQNSAPIMTFEMVDDFSPIGLQPVDVERLLYNMNGVVDMMDYVDEENFNVNYSSIIRKNYINSSFLRFIFRIHLREGGEYKASIYLARQEQIIRYYITRDEFQRLMEVIESSYDRNEDVIDQLISLNQKV